MLVNIPYMEHMGMVSLPLRGRFRPRSTALRGTRKKRAPSESPQRWQYSGPWRQSHPAGGPRFWRKKHGENLGKLAEIHGYSMI
jgi:hypothetical protein